jgi:flagellar FliL protein
MAQNIKPAAQKPEDPTVPKTSSKKMLLGIIAALVLVIVAAAGWYFTKGHDTAHVAEVKVEPPKTPIFVALETFTVNLHGESSDQYLQLGISLKVFEAENEAKIKTSQPEIRSKILQLLTTKTATELLSADGKTQLIKEIMSISNSVIGIVNAVPNPTPALLPAAHGAESEAQQLAATASAPGAVAVAASAPIVHVAVAPAEKKGVVDVLFTSFIIQ